MCSSVLMSRFGLKVPRSGGPASVDLFCCSQAKKKKGVGRKLLLKLKLLDLSAEQEEILDCFVTINVKAMDERLVKKIT